MINPKEHPLAFVQNIQSIFTQIRGRVKNYSSIIRIVKDQDFKIVMEDLDPSSNFSFEIFEPEFPNNRVVFQIKQTPANNINLDSKEHALFSEQILRNLDGWISLITQYNNIQISSEDKILKAYEDEYYDSFKLTEDDANDKPYEVGKQLMLAEFLDSAIVALSNHETIHEDLIIEATAIKEELPNLTKQATVKRLSRFFALVRKKGIEFLKSLIIAAKDEAIKQVVSGGFDLVKGIL
ncbi:hypothetical protein DWB61_02665 [Ancylomarina euxinus]|uniref:Uncharacterized protein n=1 Tax=Ancylomarina euxinus TaxID=2283627 RepID=A0A425Y6R0_9BACT|nr:hypothetical protein [Ancylomarina euxinus]MCZ4694095.1 hypothetical protein [Ancylomarina euxinus]MUP15760.1 hypothetical protein [Ancylomarina euxinus]RRG24035.1 hypothetical protein DWB61_02665 [Ancylomarina euxinus]